ncbi:recombinase family protein [Paenibacillus graminis]|uniref:recombinase family protein n=1 Tax=Paenibacillus graminis TaxID=189425 RepID=UPI002DBC4BE8|nr:recombinase family protein [Paenibacillus graminis]MEC0169855.1 recombinase family protein [Paenibacillus graminis]
MLNFTNVLQEKDVAVYARVSSDDQQERETIENQIEFAQKYCELHKMNIVGWYKDDGVTGTIGLDQREDGKRLLEDAKTGRFKIVLIYNMKRLGRKARVTLDAIYQLEEHGVKIKSMTEPFDTGDPMGRFIITVLAGQAEFDRDTLLDTLWHGANRHARLGKWLGGIVPYGYRVNSERFLEVNEEPLPGKPDLSEASIIRLMYHLVANEKMSTVKVADYFNSLRIPPSYVVHGRKVKNGKRKENTAGVWSPSRIRNMIVNPTYKGIHEYGKRATRERELIVREVASIVSVETWERAQQALRDNQIEAFRNQTRFYLLRGIIKCGCCGLTYYGGAFNGPKRKQKAYYMCGGKTAYKGPLQGKCYSKNIPAEWIEDLVWQECLRFIKNPGEALKELETGIDTRKTYKAKYIEEKSMILKRIHEKEPERQSILSLYRQKMIKAIDVEKQLQDILLETEALEHRAKELDKLMAAEQDLAYQFDTAEELLSDLRTKIESDITFETKREIVKILVDEIIVETIEPLEGGRKKAIVNIRYSFNKSRGVLHTGMDSSNKRVKAAREM